MQGLSAEGVSLRVMASNRVWDWMLRLLPEQGVHLSRCAEATDLFAESKDSRTVGLLDWAQAGGLLGKEHLREFRVLCQRIPVILLVPRQWRNMLNASDLGVAAILSKPLELNELLAKVEWLASQRGTVRPLGPLANPIDDQTETGTR